MLKALSILFTKCKEAAASLSAMPPTFKIKK
jgi:hypothetical protein